MREPSDEESRVAFLKDGDGEENLENHVSHSSCGHRSSQRAVLLPSIAFSLAIGVLLGYLIFSLPSVQNPSHKASPCTKPRLRREWRTLSTPEKDAYISAVQCLRTRPAILAQGSLYDDFAYVHKCFGSYSHKAAAFLPWHRYFIFQYERFLREDCGYDGGLPYWDWTRDWEDITRSPVFDAETGFGGDGNATGEITVGGGRCVVDGPFAGLKALRYDAEYEPHCLSRGFLKGTVLKKMCGDDITPEKVEGVLQMGDFESFMHALEEGPHIAISTGIRGDWVKFTVPYGKWLDWGLGDFITLLTLEIDPLWFLHHSQLDRLWWIWQQADRKRRLTAYSGKADNNTDAAASLTDVMDYGGFVPNIQVSQLMDTSSGLLCYKYE